jgi:hypothetical protein
VLIVPNSQAKGYQCTPCKQIVRQVQLLKCFLLTPDKFRKSSPTCVFNLVPEQFHRLQLHLVPLEHIQNQTYTLIANRIIR